MDFKIGDKVKVIKDNWGKNLKGKVGIVKRTDKTSCVVSFPNWAEGWFGNSSCWGFSSNELELLESKKITKTELLAMPIGTKITTDAANENYKVFVKLSEKDFENEQTCIMSIEINEDLTLNTDKNYGTKIIKIEKPNYNSIYHEIETKKMTVSEICKELGYDIEIVKED